MLNEWFNILRIGSSNKLCHSLQKSQHMPSGLGTFSWFIAVLIEFLFHKPQFVFSILGKQ